MSVATEVEVRAFDRFTYYGAKYLGQTGQNLYLAALFILAGTSDNAALGLSTVFIATLIPAIILGLPGGALVDRIGAARGFSLGASLRLASVVLGFAILPSNPEYAWLIALLYSGGSQIFTPAEMALVPAVQANGAGRAHSLLVGLQYAGQGTGMLVLAPALYFMGGPPIMLLGAVGAFVALMAAASLLDLRLRRTVAGLKLPTRRAFAFGETFAYFGRERRAGYAVALLGYKTVGAKCLVIALPFYMSSDLGLGAQGIAYLFVPLVVGVVVGLLWAGKTVTLESAPGVMRMIFIGLIVGALAAAALDYGLTAAAQYSHVPPIARLEADLNTTFAVALPVAFLLGLCFATALVTCRLVLTETAPIGQQARVFATQLTLTEALILLPLAIAGIGTEWAGARATLGVVAVLGVVLLVMMELMMAEKRVAQQTGGQVDEPAPVAPALA